MLVVAVGSDSHTMDFVKRIYIILVVVVLTR